MVTALTAPPRSLIDRLTFTCHKCKDGQSDSIPSGYICRCGAPEKTELAPARTELVLPVPPELRPGSERIVGTPLAWAPAIPVAIAQPRNVVPFWIRRWDRAMQRGLERLPEGIAGLAIVMLWMASLLVVAVVLSALHHWNGGPPEIVTRDPKLLEERRR